MQTHFELAIYLEHQLAERGRPARREVTQYAATYEPAKRSRAEPSAPERVVSRGGLRLGLEEVGHARVRREAEHVLRCAREGRRPEELRELGVERGESRYVEGRGESGCKRARRAGGCFGRYTWAVKGKDGIPCVGW